MTTTDPATIGMTALDLAQAGRFAELREMFAPSLRSMVTMDTLRAAWLGVIERNGPVTATGKPVSDPAGPAGTLVRIPVVFAHGQVTALATVTETGWVTGIQFATADAAQAAQPWQRPDYADPDAFQERDVTLGSGPFAVPGTLSLPDSSGPQPAAVVFLTGSGPQDRDETIGRNKPLKDIAWGLASRGIAVLRFDKVTNVRPEHAAEFTVDDEYLHHATAAIQLLQQQPTIDPARIFVLGHSLGGTIAPRVAVVNPTVAGLVILAGGAQPLHWAAVRQFLYLSSLDPSAAASLQPTIDTLTRQARAVDSPDLSAATPSSDLPFGVPAAYWLDLRSYDPAAVAARLDTPMLLLQGGRDYQVTIADDLALWRTALAGRAGVTIHVYDADNHMFFIGNGPSTPAEYEAAQHVDPAVVTDIANWLTTQPAPATAA